MPTLSSLFATCDNKVGIMTALKFQWAHIQIQVIHVNSQINVFHIQY